MNALAPSQAQIGFGQVRHTRHRPQRSAFAYATYFLMLPMRSLRAHGPGALARNRRAALSFHDTDHGDGRTDSLAWLDEVLLQHGVQDAQGEVWLHTYPRVLGYAFKPVSFWYCHRADGSLRTVLAEVNNTFGERHCYLLDAPRYGRPCEADKVFHVSPFCPLRGRYRFFFMRTGGASPRTVARIDYFDGEDRGQALLNTSVSGELPLDACTLRRALWSHPAMTLGVVGRIHWQALRLWYQRAPSSASRLRPVRSSLLRPSSTRALALLLALLSAAWPGAWASNPEATQDAALRGQQELGSARLRYRGLDVYDARLYVAPGFDARRYEDGASRTGRSVSWCGNFTSACGASTRPASRWCMVARTCS